MLKQSLDQRQLLKLSPQQIQLMKLLQVPTMDLEQRIKEELEINPALEELEVPQNQQESEDSDLDSLEKQSSQEDIDPENSRDTDEFDMTDYYDEDDIASYKLRDNNYVDTSEISDRPFSFNLGFHDQLLQQMGMLDLSKQQQQIGELIIGNLDDAGYLQRSLESMVNDIAFSNNIIVSEQEVEWVLHQIQELEPAGVGARNLQECLLLQIDALLNDENTPFLSKASLSLAREIVQDYFEAFTKRQYEKIIDKLDVDEDELREAFDEIIHLNPKPGMAVFENTTDAPLVMPDFYLTSTDGKLHLSLNDRNDPDLRVSPSYMQMYSSYNKKKQKHKQEKEANVFLKQKIDSAQWFIDLIKQRYNTLYSIMQTIIDYQLEYFVNGDISLLKPMRLKDIAALTNLDISTISRVTANKYIQTHFGIFLLKDFFS
ncbi:MAG: RNA polymerase factor sigma-54, partial [Bacteroidales bacterium]